LLVLFILLFLGVLLGVLRVLGGAVDVFLLERRSRGGWVGGKLVEWTGGMEWPVEGADLGGWFW
jgi:hypothetical protein